MLDPEMLDAVIDLIEVWPHDRILDLGCGDGASTRRLARRAVHGLALGVDPSDDNVRQARRLSVEIENVMFVQGSPEEIPWQNDFFSVLLAREPATEPAAREMFRVLAPGGRAFVLQSGSELLAAAGFEAVRSRALPGGDLVVEAQKAVLR
ncbi:MAG: class I SAM-dependent methyltransferase [Acidobacteria bacterium]|nr:class I SAM-dependent methyltransferase [Acidobacteriota bacterium]